MEFYEARPVRGELPGLVLGLSAAALGGLGLLLSLPIAWRALTLTLAVLVLWYSAARLETVVDANRLTMRVSVLWRRVIELEDVAAVEVVVVDSWPFGGGFSAALVDSVEPGRDRGSRAVRVELRDGRVTQLYTRDARALRDAIDAGRGISGGS